MLTWIKKIKQLVFFIMQESSQDIKQVPMDGVDGGGNVILGEFGLSQDLVPDVLLSMDGGANGGVVGKVLIIL